MKLLSTISMLAVLSIPAIAETTNTSADSNDTIEEIQVISYPSAPRDQPSPVSAPPAADSADFLRQIPGVSSGRFGGHSLEPIIRGQQQGQLSILNNGSFQMGSGPNRMDTPSTYAAVDLIDTVIVVKGYQSVLNGPGASGGFIQYDRDIPAYEDGLWNKNILGVGYEGNANTKRSFGRSSIGKDGMSIEFWGSLQEADNYTDGHDNELHTAFNDYAVGGAITFTNPQGDYIQFGYDWNKMSDALFPGAGMDSTLSGGDTYRLRGEMNIDSDLVEAVRLQSSYAKTDHYMDNFSLRQNMGMKLVSHTSSEVVFGEVEADINLGDAMWTLVADLRDSKNDGSRYMGMVVDNPDAISGAIWPEINTKIIGLAAERRHDVSDAITLTYGIRSDWTKVDFGRTTEAPTFVMMGMMPMTPNMTYMKYYHTMETDASEHQMSGLARIEWQTDDNWSFSASASKSARTANATERGMVNVMMMGGMNKSWIGNPSLLPEKHYQMDLGAHYTDKYIQLSLTAFADHVDDFILRDSARGEMMGQMGVFVNAPMADVYRNIDAKLMGFEFTGDVALSDNMSVNFDAAYVRGRDSDRGGYLPQIPPLQGAVSAHYQQGDLTLSATVRYGVRQTNVDMNPMMATGRDPRKTPGYGVVNLASKYRLNDMVDIHLGVKNLFDKYYANHLSRSNLLDATETQVNEPGRNAYFKLVARF